MDRVSKKKFDKKIIMEIDNVRIVRNDPHNYAVERLEDSYNIVGKEKKKVKTQKYQFKGYYSTIMGALRGIMYKELLIDENNIKNLKDYLIQIKQSNERVQNAIERLIK